MDCHGPVIFELLPSAAVLEGFGSVENRQHRLLYTRFGDLEKF